MRRVKLLSGGTTGPVRVSCCQQLMSGTTEWEIDTWSYRRGVRDGYIPTDVSNASTFAFPRLADGCVDASYNYTAPRRPSPDASSGPGWWWGAAQSQMSVQRGLLFSALGFVSLALL